MAEQIHTIVPAAVPCDRVVIVEITEAGGKRTGTFHIHAMPVVAWAIFDLKAKAHPDPRGLYATAIGPTFDPELFSDQVDTGYRFPDGRVINDDVNVYKSVEQWFVAKRPDGVLED